VLKLREDTIKAKGETSESYLKEEDATVTLELPDKTPPLRSIIQASRYYPNCSAQSGTISGRHTTPHLGNTYRWSANNTDLTTNALTINPMFPLGTTTVRLTVTNAYGTIDYTETDVTIRDDFETMVLEIDPPYVEISTAEPV
jgi:hypothetical protein